ncbi:hypothetical protein BT96DRAFT_1007219 [Gymnopus androsaceus JB14]|uniref:Uncharacterized protein n=1 Tax=Gymnopus androsaceus JB14 TaxID=1447944 RepID=A0A6A4GIX6_9AGAR|nr:hypothetical protein BT96DRAFT_1007219 [Gymnopus androsaceus JB14]
MGSRSRLWWEGSRSSPYCSCCCSCLQSAHEGSDDDASLSWSSLRYAERTISISPSALDESIPISRKKSSGSYSMGSSSSDFPSSSISAARVSNFYHSHRSSTRYSSIPQAQSHHRDSSTVQRRGRELQHLYFAPLDLFATLSDNHSIGHPSEPAYFSSSMYPTHLHRLSSMVLWFKLSVVDLSQG